MRIMVTEHQVRILSTCQAPRCGREVSWNVGRDRLEAISETGDGLQAIVGRIIARVLGAAQGREDIRVAGLEELPGAVCDRCLADLAAAQADAHPPDLPPVGSVFELVDAGRCLECEHLVESHLPEESGGGCHAYEVADCDCELSHEAVEAALDDALEAHGE